MLISIFLGALLYGLIQFFWYSPIGFGRQWLSFQSPSPEEALEKISQTSTVAQGIEALLFPAFLMSMALHALWVVLERLPPEVFFLATLSFGILTVGKKYFRWNRAPERERGKWYVEDGAFLTSLFILALFVFSLQNRLY